MADHFYCRNQKLPSQAPLDFDRDRNPAFRLVTDTPGIVLSVQKHTQAVDGPHGTAVLFLKPSATVLRSVYAAASSGR